MAEVRTIASSELNLVPSEAIFPETGKADGSG